MWKTWRLKNFKVWEDNKEQQLKTFSFGADPNGPGGQKRYIVLFFDNSTMAVGEQVQARQAAARFIESNAGPDRLMAVVNFTDALQIAQNFTSDIDKLKQVVGGHQVVGDGAGAASGEPGRAADWAAAWASTAARSMLLALRSMAKNMTEIPGRKSLILFTSGFPLSNEARSEANAAIDACNKANVAIYPIDVRGDQRRHARDDGRYSSSMPGRRGRAALEFPQAFPGVACASSGIALAASPVLRIASFFLGARSGSSRAVEAAGAAAAVSPGGGAGGSRVAGGGRRAALRRHDWAATRGQSGGRHDARQQSGQQSGQHRQSAATTRTTQ